MGQAGHGGSPGVGRTGEVRPYPPAALARGSSVTITGAWSDSAPRSGSSGAPGRAQAVAEHVVDAVAAERLEARRRRRADVEVAAEQRRPAAGPARASRPRRARCRPARALGRVHLRVEVRAPRPVRRARRRGRRGARASGAAARCGARRSRPAPRTRIAFAPPPFDLMRSGQRSAIARRSGEQRVARGQRRARLGVAGARERRRPPRRDLLQERDVPVPARERGGELGAQIAPARRAPRGRGRGSRSARASRRRLPGLTRHLLTGTELDRDELLALLDRADALKAAPLSSRALEGRSVALIFEKHSTRTRLSFEAGDLRARRPAGRAAPRRAAALARRVGRRHRAHPVAPHGGDRRAHRPRRAARGARRRPPPCRSSTCSPPAITPARRSPTS